MNMMYQPPNDNDGPLSIDADAKMIPLSATLELLDLIVTHICNL